LAPQYLKFVVGDGSQLPISSLARDWWHPDGILYEKYGYRVIYNDATRYGRKAV